MLNVVVRVVGALFFIVVCAACTLPKTRMTLAARLPRVAITRTAAVVVTHGVPAAILTPEECKLFLPLARVQYTRRDTNTQLNTHPNIPPAPVSDDTNQREY